MNVSIEILNVVHDAVDEVLRDLQAQTEAKVFSKLPANADKALIKRVIATAIDPILDCHLED